jgi:hypothetical protein
MDIAVYADASQNALDIQPGLGGAASVSAKFPGMVISGVRYDEKEPAAKALLESCKTVTDKVEKDIGEYMGFKLSLRMEGMTLDKKFRLLIRGSMTYQIDLGADAFGNITRINNVLSELPKRLDGAKSQLETVLSQQEAAKQELEKPFALADELREKETRLALLNAELNIEGSGGLDVMNEPDDRSAEREQNEDADYDEDYELDDIDGEDETSPFNIVNPGASVNYSSVPDRQYAYGKSRPPLLETIRNYSADKKAPAPGKKTSEREI